MLDSLNNNTTILVLSSQYTINSIQISCGGDSGRNSDEGSGDNSGGSGRRKLGRRTRVHVCGILAQDSTEQRPPPQTSTAKRTKYYISETSFPKSDSINSYETN